MLCSSSSSSSNKLTTSINFMLSLPCFVDTVAVLFCFYVWCTIVFDFAILDILVVIDEDDDDDDEYYSDLGM